MVRQLLMKNFDKGEITRVEDHSIPENAASSSLNWLTLGDRIELSGGYTVVGTELAGAGRVTGLHIGELVDGTKQEFYSHNQKLKYYDSATDDWAEIGTDQLGADADGEDISMTNYVSSAGYQTWISSPNSSLYKIMNASPGSIKDMFDAAKNFKGYIDAANNRLHLWFRDQFKNILYGSYKDVQNATVYTSVSTEAIGASGSTNYTGTLAAVTGKRTCFNVVFTDGTLTAQDDKNGNFTGDATGTINYTTGVYDITFDSATTGAVTADYDWEDSSSAGLADFTFTSPTRVATEGYFLPQTTGGDLLAVEPYKAGDVTGYYCIHENEAWYFEMPIADTGPTNIPYRKKLGMKNHRAAVATGDGIYYVDTSDPNEPRLKLITLSASNDQVEPIEISFNVDLSDLNFDTAVSYEWGDYIVFACATDTANNRLYAFHKHYKSFDPLKYNVSVLRDNLGVLWAGDSGANNVLKLFTGFHANGAIIQNHWEGKMSRLKVEELKKVKRLTLRGLIDGQQQVRVSVAYDRGDFVTLGTIDGDGSYVNQANSNTVGSPQVGSTEVGGGTTPVSGYEYRREFRIRSRKFDEIKLRVEALKTGYVSVSTIDWYDIKAYGQKNLKRYRATN